LQQEIVDLTPGADRLHILRSPYGHDGFLVENEQVGEFTRHALARAENEATIER
jgi:homoserine O-acetyltransferase